MTKVSATGSRSRIAEKIERLGIEGIPPDAGPLPQLTLEVVREMARSFVEPPRPRRRSRRIGRLVFPRRPGLRLRPAA